MRKTAPLLLLVLALFVFTVSQAFADSMILDPNDPDHSSSITYDPTSDPSLVDSGTDFILRDGTFIVENGSGYGHHGSINLDTRGIFNIRTGGSHLVLGGVVSGGILAKTGSNALKLENSNNSFSGGLWIGEGSVFASAPGVQGSGEIYVGSGATFKVDILNTDSITIGNVISGAGNVKTGWDSGDLVLTGNNTYTDGTSIESSTLTLKNENAAGSGAIALTKTGSSAPILNLDFTGTLANKLIDPDGSVINVVNGSDITYTGDGSDYTGSVNIKDDSRFTLDGSTIDGDIYVDNGSTFGGAGSVTSITLSPGSTLALGHAKGGLTATSTAQGLLASLGSNILVDLKHATGGTFLALNGSELLPGGPTGVKVSLKNPHAGFWTLVSFGAGGSTAVLEQGNDNSNANLITMPSADNQKLYMAVNMSGQTLKYWNNVSGAAWRGSTTNWADAYDGASSSVAWGNADGTVGIFLDDGTPGTRTVNLADAIRFDTLHFKDDYTVAIAVGMLTIAPVTGNTGIISVDEGKTATINANIYGGDLAKYGGGTLVLGDSNQYGNTEIYGGWVQVARDDRLSQNPNSGILLDGGGLAVDTTSSEPTITKNITLGSAGGRLKNTNAANYAIFSGAISGIGGLTLGDGVTSSSIHLLGENTYSGGTLVNKLSSVSAASTAAFGTGDVYAQDDTSIIRFRGTGTYKNSFLGYGTLYVDDNAAFSGDIVQADSFLIDPNKTATVEKVLEAKLITLSTGSKLVANTLRLNGFSQSFSGSGNPADCLTYNTLEVIGKGNALGAHDVLGAVFSADTSGKTLRFVLTPDMTDGAAMLDSSAVTGNALDLTGSRVELVAGGVLGGLSIGDKLILASDTRNDPDSISSSTTYGAIVYGFQYDDTTANQLVFALKSRALTGGADGDAHAYLQAGSSTQALLKSSTMFVGTTGVDSAVTSTPGEHNPGQTQVAVMASFEGQSMREDTGSHVDVDSMSIMTGPVWRFDNNLGSTRLGLFVEAGFGSYDTHNSFATGSSSGDGDVEHYGGGVLLRHDFLNKFYAEGSLRIGRVSNDFNHDDIANGDFDELEGAYYGGHLGAGYIWDVTEADSLDLYAKLFWTHQEGDSVTTDANQRLKVKDADSTAHRIGARYTRKFTDCASAFVGAAWEHEYDGKVKGSLEGLRISPTKTDGSSAFGEIGVNVNPVDSNWHFTLKAHGNLGQREGGGGAVQISYEF